MSKDSVQEISRSRWLWLWVLIASIALICAFVLGTFVRSPWEEARENSNLPVIVTAQVQERTFSDGGEIVRGVASLGTEQMILASGTDHPVITSVHVKPGELVTSGTLVATVSGRPVIVLHLPFPLYRDLTSGITGPDVLAVQEELHNLGYYSGKIDGVYGLGTANAVQTLMEEAGSNAAPVPKDAVDLVAQMQQELKSARASQSELRTGQEVSPLDRAQAKEVVSKAEADLKTAMALAITPLMHNEFARITSDKATMIQVAEQGADLSISEEPIAQLRYGHATSTARIGVQDVQKFKVGTQVSVSGSDNSKREWLGSVMEVGEFTTTPSELSSLPGRDITIQIPAPEDLADKEELVIEALEAEAAQSGLAVPVAALRQSGEKMHVIKMGTDRNGTQTREQVVVQVVTTSDGFALVEAEDLSVMDEVLVSD